jgi:excisionase family DNA binding protein
VTLLLARIVAQQADTRMKPMEMNGAPAPTRNSVLAYRISELGPLIGVGRSTIYRLIGEGRLRAMKIGHRTVICGESVRRFLGELPAATCRSYQR